MQLDNNRLFNGDRKIDYLNTGCKYDEMTKPVIMMWFDKASVVEAATINSEGEKGKDLAEFNLPEIENMYKSFNLRARTTLTTISSFFADYYNWCVVNGFVDNTNVQNFYASTMIKDIINRTVPIELIENKFFTDNILKGEYMPAINDETDQFTLYAVHSGVYGLEYEDLSNLKLSDIDQINKTAQLYSGLVINVDDYFIELAKKADEQTCYHPEGKAESWMNKYDESIYILKTCRKKVANLPVSKQAIMTKFTTIKIQTGNKFLNGNTVYKNGIINYVKKQFKNNQSVTLKEALFRKRVNGDYFYSKELDQYINEFGSKMLGRALRQELKEIIDYYN